ncbi:MAG: sulfotransferase domain-containing protein [Deltaproteobacteria bacterium]|nr:sulfotransferase domain-containing protein [Deltaproteobacteria bacterium]
MHSVIAPAARQKLNYVKVSDPDVRLDRFPDFLIIGPQRTGTTWLHAQLRFHPEIQLSEPKELFFFSRLKTPSHPKYQSNELSWYLRFFRDPPWLFLAKTLICLRRYRRLYRPRVRGEATASYAAIDSDVIREIAVLNPDIKAVLMIRNPVDRAWSHAKKDLVRNRGRRFADVGEAEFLDFFNDEYQRQCAHYVDHIERWSAELRDGHLFVGLFDDIDRRPEELLIDVMRFLGVDDDRRYLPADLRESVNPTAESRIPPAYRSHLEALFGDDMAALRQRFGIVWPIAPTSAVKSFVYHRAPALTATVR